MDFSYINPNHKHPKRSKLLPDAGTLWVSLGFAPVFLGFPQFLLGNREPKRRTPLRLVEVEAASIRGRR